MSRTPDTHKGSWKLLDRKQDQVTRYDVDIPKNAHHSTDPIDDSITCMCHMETCWCADQAGKQYDNKHQTYSPMWLEVQRCTCTQLRSTWQLLAATKPTFYSSTQASRSCFDWGRATYWSSQWQSQCSQQHVVVQQPGLGSEGWRPCQICQT